MNEYKIIELLNQKEQCLIHSDTGMIEGDHWSGFYPKVAMECGERETIWPHFTYTEHHCAYYDLSYQDGYMQIIPSLQGLKRLLELLYADTQRLPHTLDSVFRVFLSSGGYAPLSMDEKAQIGVMGSSPVLKIRSNYWLFTSDSFLSPAQVLMNQWYIEGACVHKEVELNEDTLHLFL